MNIFNIVILTIFSCLSIIASFLLGLHLFTALAEYRKRKEQYNLKDNKHIDKISVVIPAYNEESNIAESLDSVLKQNRKYIKEIIVVINNCYDRTERIVDEYTEKFPLITKVEMVKIFGKPEAIKTGLQYADTDFVILIDADISLEKDCFEKVLTFHFSNRNDYSTCLIDPITVNKLTPKALSCDRLFRQRILQVARNKYGLANNPGGFLVANRKELISLTKSSLVEDLVVTYDLFKSGRRVELLREVLAYEKERLTVKNHINQRARWIIGNFKCTRHFLQTFSYVSSPKKVIIASYPFLWYFLRYLITFEFLVIPFNLYILLPLSLTVSIYFLCIYKAVKAIPLTDFNLLDILAHSTLFNFIVTISTIKALFFIFKNANKNSYFYERNLFTRDNLSHKLNR